MRAALAAPTSIAVLAGASASGSADAQVVVIRVKLCTPAEVKNLVNGFVVAFNAGDARGLDRAWAREPDFRWYSTDAPGERLLPTAADRASLQPYFARRHGRGERLTLRSLQVNGHTVATGNLKAYGNFQYRLVRDADDLQPARYQGKGALHCYHGVPDRLIVWSMGREA